MSQPVPVQLRPVQTGDDVVVAVEGGFVRRKAPCDGAVIELPDREVFLPAEALIEVLQRLDRLPRPAPTEQLPLAPAAPARGRR